MRFLSMDDLEGRVSDEVEVYSSGVPLSAIQRSGDGNHIAVNQSTGHITNNDIQSDGSGGQDGEGDGKECLSLTPNASRSQLPLVIDR